jgi:hypothetical protein
MTGKAKPTAAAKKPTAAAKKPTAAAKKPTAAAKKPTAAAKKPTAAAKKPNTKFNLNKLIMLIGRYPQKKGKKMMGGAPYANNILGTLKGIIHNFLFDNKVKLLKIIRDFYIDNGPVGTHHFSTKNFTRNIAFNLYNLTDVNTFTSDTQVRNNIIGGIAGGMSTLIFDACNKSNIEAKHIFNGNFMIIAQVLCKVYTSLHNNSDDNNTDQIVIVEIPEHNPSITALDQVHNVIDTI